EQALHPLRARRFLACAQDRRIRPGALDRASDRRRTPRRDLGRERTRLDDVHGPAPREAHGIGPERGRAGWRIPPGPSAQTCLVRVLGLDLGAVTRPQRVEGAVLVDALVRVCTEEV